ncbi:lytic murein transglycosylase [Wenxinia saemankumensis]|uniref:Lytic murein transglycosylase n=1 Tax=Wenxinia saemankumensis TaxID=1447782 RepID=A0A1M6EFM4_9RHOB|nr:lytic murein transglycosylase [Wenxinia saemankumensis]SHI84265.1 lytic murein transglycosylase [Wenxinia saemankumensis]
MRRAAPLALLAALGAAPLAAQDSAPCGGDFGTFLQGVEAEAVASGIDPATASAFVAGLGPDPEVIAADRRQGVFQLDFLTFSRRLISQDRIDRGRAMADRHATTFDRIEAEYGVPRGVLLAFWAFETDYGAVQGDFGTLDALATLAHDCRRPELFRPQLVAAAELFAMGEIDHATTGAWAGEIGQVQMLPADILENGRDGDGDGRIDLKGSAPDALMSGGAMLQALGWRADEPWLVEVTVPDGLDWASTGLNHPRPVANWAAAGVAARDGALPGGGPGTGLEARLLLPQGRNGPAFLAYPNFDVYFEWNQSFVYVTTAAYFATRLMGAPIYLAGDPDPGLSGEQMIALQEKLVARGHDVGGVDGILGERTREAVQVEQQRLGLPADAWPTPALLGAL